MGANAQAPSRAGPNPTRRAHHGPAGRTGRTGAGGADHRAARNTRAPRQHRSSPPPTSPAPA
eukprot:8159290-Lingulodinium_polyedra.AAC.1